jgi:signal transduction histidine kinase/ActR/RegA family two-component response regulator
MVKQAPLKTPRTLREKAKQLLAEHPDRLVCASQQGMEELLHELSLLRIEQELREQELRDARERRSAEKMEALAVMAMGIAHDFNNVLAAMIGFTELAKDRVPKESRQERHLQRVMEAGARGRELISQLLTFSRKSAAALTPLQLSSVVRETVELLRASIPPAVGIKVAIDGESGLVLGDARQMQHVLMHLCTNAAQAMGEKGGVLDIALCDFNVPAGENTGGIDAGPYVKLVVSDTGCGMQPEVIDKVFDPFFTTKTSGPGLGLSVVHGIVRQHGGCITVDSTKGKGSAFTVYLPRAAPAPGRDDAEERAVSRGHKRILFIDDEEIIVDLGGQVMKKLGYMVTGMTSGSKALALFRRDPMRFDLVITDQTMPGVTGLELAGLLRKARADIPVILCTGYSQSVDANAAEEAGIRAVIMKPFTRDEIARAVSGALEKKQ